MSGERSIIHQADGVCELRGRLLALRDDLRGRLAADEIIEPAWLVLLADVETVLRSTAMPEPAARAVVSDDGSTIWLTAYTKAGEAVPVALLPVRAIALAGELIQAALPKLADPLRDQATVRRTGRRRGGDPHAEQRRRRDEAIRTLAPLIARGASTEEQARVIARRLVTFHPMPQETSPERRLLREIKSAELPLVGHRRIREILAKQ
jgi:hypothetical protein